MKSPFAIKHNSHRLIIRRTQNSLETKVSGKQSNNKMGDNFHPQDNQMPVDEGSSGVPPSAVTAVQVQDHNGQVQVQQVEVAVDNPVVDDTIVNAAAAAAAESGEVQAAAANPSSEETAIAAALVNANQLPPQPVDASHATGVLGAPPVDAGPHEEQQHHHHDQHQHQHQHQHQPVELQQVPVQVQQFQPLIEETDHVGVGVNANVDANHAHAHAVTTGETIHIEIPMPKVDDGTGAPAATNTVNGVTIVHHEDHVTQDHHDGTADPTAAMEAMPALTIPDTPAPSMVHTPHSMTHTTPRTHSMHQITAATAGLSAAASSLIATPTKPSTKQERMDAIWMKHYKELQEYKAQHGHVRVPRKSGPLGEWVRTQRRYYKLWRRGESVPLTKERMELLDHLGFVWLPAEEKVGGGFRGGRPKKRKREEEDALAAANAAAAAAAVAAGGHTNPAFFHHLASPAALSIAANTTLVGMEEAAAEAASNLEEGGNVDETAPPTPGHVGGTGEEDVVAVATVDSNGQVIGSTNPADAATAASMANIPSGVGVGVPGMPVPMPVYTYHHDPFHFQSMSKRSDIANQINMLNNRQSLNRQHNQGPKIEYATEGLANAHDHYEDVVYVLKRSNEELRDAELALDRAKKTYDQAEALKDKADALLARASEEVLTAELEEGNDEWIAMYKCLVKYKEENGNILFPRLSNADKNSGSSSTSTPSDGNGLRAADLVSYGTVGVGVDGEVIGVANAVPKTEETVPMDVNEGDANKVTTENPDAPDSAVATGEGDAVTPAPQDVAAATTTTTTTETAEDGGVKQEEGKADEPMGEQETVLSVAAAVAAATATTVQMEGVSTETAIEGKELKKDDDPQAMDVDTPTAEGTTPTEEKATEGAATEAIGEAKEGDSAVSRADADSQMAPPPGTAFVHTSPNTVDVTEPLLHDWVGKMRKFPKKQFKKWRRYALDKLGFVW